MSGITNIFFSLRILSPSKVEDPLLPSAISLAFISPALLLLIANSSAAGTRISQGFENKP